MLPHVEGYPVPRGYHVETSGGELLMGLGGTMWGITYLGGLYGASTADFSNGTTWLLLPIVGPWAAISERKISCDSGNLNVQCVDDAESEIVAYAFLTGAGMIQVLGATLFFVGVGNRRDQLVRDDLSSVALVPLRLDNGGMGLAAWGVF